MHYLHIFKQVLQEYVLQCIDVESESFGKTMRRLSRATFIANDEKSSVRACESVAYEGKL